MVDTAIIFHKEDAISGLDLDSLVIHNRYRGHPELDDHDHQRLFRHTLLSTLNSGGICASINNESKLVAVCAIQPLEWDSMHFGIPMAKLVLAAERDCSATSLEQLLEATLSKITNPKNLHISSEVDIDEYVVLNTLLRLGAEVVDVKREYRWTSLRGIKVPKFLSSIREYRIEDKPQVMQLLDESLFESRFSRDSLLSRDKVTSLYRVWLERLLAGRGTDSLALVMERHGKIQACGTLAKLDMHDAGVPVQIMSNGLYVASPNATGKYYSVIYALAEESLTKGISAQTCVSLNHHAATRVLEKMNVGTRSIRYALRLKK